MTDTSQQQPTKEEKRSQPLHLSRCRRHAWDGPGHVITCSRRLKKNQYDKLPLPHCARARSINAASSYRFGTRPLDGSRFSSSSCRCNRTPVLKWQPSHKYSFPLQIFNLDLSVKKSGHAYWNGVRYAAFSHFLTGSCVYMYVLLVTMFLVVFVQLKRLRPFSSLVGCCWEVLVISSSPLFCVCL